MKEELFIYGAGGHAKVVVEIVEATGQVIGGIFDKNMLLKTLLNRYVIHHELDELPPSSLNTSFIVAIGNNTVRKKVVKDELGEMSYVTLVHPSASVSSSAAIGIGTVVMAGATINAESKIGAHAIINTNSSVDHDCIIADYVHLSPNVALAGNVSIGEGTHVGIGACVIQGIHIGKWCTIGAGAVVIRDVPDGATLVGNPGRIIK